MEYEHLRPLGIGEILDISLRIYRKRFGALVATVTFVVVPLAVLQLLFQISRPTTVTTTRFQGGGTFTTTQTPPGVTFALLAVTVLVSLLTTALAQGASMRIVADQYLGTATTWRTSLRAAAKQLPSLLWVAILVGAAWVIGAMFCGIPGIYLYVAFSVAIPVLLMEGTKGTKALGRSRRLVTGRWWPTFAALLVVFALSTVLTTFAGVIVGGATIFTSTVTTSTTVKVLQAALTTLISVFTTPITAAVTTVIYFDLRVRHEGFDIALMVQRLDAPAVPRDDAGPSAGADPVIDRHWPTTAPTTAPPPESPWAMDPEEPLPPPDTPPGAEPPP